MKDIKIIWDIITEYWDRIPPIARYIIVGFVGLWAVLYILSHIKKLWVENFKPIFYNAEQKKKRTRRQLFAMFIEREISHLNNKESWQDYRFAELEAEVEAEGEKRQHSWIPFLKRTLKGLQREKSLSKALEQSQERLILLEGEPGSGKSVALRYVAQSMAAQAKKVKKLNSIIPIFVNLKKLTRKEDVPIDRELIENFILDTLKRVNDCDVDEFLDNRFREGLQNGTWLFLFDSFDELPEVLSSTDADETIRNYGDAISDFLHGMNQCRGIIASRHFRGPGRLGWPRFRILKLSEQRKSELIHKANLDVEMEKELIGQLGLALPEIRSMTGNPMFLGLLCEHIKTGKPFPQNGHSVFETYIQKRLTRDEERLQKRFSLTPESMRKAAEILAFSMTANHNLGLSPTRQELKNVLGKANRELNQNFHTYLDALEYIKIAHSETNVTAGDSKPFTFSHRRFQEYFSTCVVLHEPHLVKPVELLTDARWRETAVVMCQTQPIESLSPIIQESQKLISGIIGQHSRIIENPIEYVQSLENEEQDENSEANETLPEPFTWPQGAIHLFGLLQDGFESHLDDLPEGIRVNVARLILTASEKGILPDKKWGLEVAGVLPHSVLLRILRTALNVRSQWLNEVVYRQVARLHEIPKDVATWIRGALIELLIEKRLKRDRHSVKAHISRLDKSSELLSTLKLLLSIPIVDLLLHMSLIPFLFFLDSQFMALVCGLLIIISYLSLRYALGYLVILISRLRIPDSSSFFIGTIGLIIRMGSNVFLVSTFYTVQHFSTYWPMFITIVIYMFTWAPSALISARHGHYNHQLWWPVMPITPVFLLAKNVKRMFKFIKNNYSILFILPFAIMSMVPLIYLTERFPLLKSFFGAITVVMAVTLSLIALFNWLRDFVRLQRWKKLSRTTMTGKDFFVQLIQFKMEAIRLKFIELITAKDFLEANRESEALLEDLSLVIEQQKKARSLVFKEKGIQKKKGLKIKLKEKIDTSISMSNILENWHKEFTKSNNKNDSNYPFYKWRQQTLDQISKLLEQIRNRRRD